MAISGRPKYDDTIVDYSVPHIFKAPYQSVMAPHSEKVNVADTITELIGESKEYTYDLFNTIPTNTNVGASVNYGHGPLSNGNIKRYRRTGDSRGLMAKEPFLHPEGGWMYTWPDAKVPEEYGPDNRRAVRYVDAPPVIEHWEDPLISFPTTSSTRIITDRFIVPVVPNVVYSGKEDFEKLNPIRISKQIQNSHILSVLPPVYGNFLKIDNQMVPLHFKDPNYVAMQASLGMPLEIPLPDGKVVKLKDYKWTVVQNVDAETQLIVELPPHLKEKRDMSFTLSNFSGQSERNVEKELRALTDKKQYSSHNAPVIDQTFNQYLSLGGTPNIHPSKVYYSVDNALETIPNGDLEPVQAQIKSKPTLYVQPEPAATAPWYF